MTVLNDALGGSSKKVVVIAPHPDDEVLGVGGTMKLLIDAGSKVKVVVVTSGSRGSPKAMKEPSARAELAARRADEERSCAAFLGYSCVQFGLEAAHPVYLVAEKLKREIDGADLIFVPHLNDKHPTHVAVTRALLDAEPSCEVWGYEIWGCINDPDLFVDITSAVETKTEAVKFHRSQQEYRDMAGAFKGLARYRGMFSKNYPDSVCDYSECFKLIISPQGLK